MLFGIELHPRKFHIFYIVYLLSVYEIVAGCYVKCYLFWFLVEECWNYCVLFGVHQAFVYEIYVVLELV